jgi:PAP2 superfamily protein
LPEAPVKFFRGHRVTRLAAVRLAALACGAALLAHPLPAQRTLKRVARDLNYGVRDMLWVWASPLRADRDEWAMFAAGAGFVGATMLFDDEFDRLVRRHPNSAVMRALKPVREEAKIPLYDLGSGKRLQPLSGAMYVLGFAFDSRALRDAGLGCASTQQANIFVHHGAYALISRERPKTSNGDPYRFELGGGAWEQHSFYGGHAGNIMGCVTYWNERFDLGVAEPVLYALAIGIGLGRAADQRHWLSDTVTGMLVGHAFGRVIGRRARARSPSENVGQTMAPAAKGLSFHASGSSGDRTLVIGWKSTF